MLIASKDKEEIKKLKLKLKKQFEMKELGEAKKFFGMEIERDRKNFELQLTKRNV